MCVCTANTRAIGPVEISYDRFDLSQTEKNAVKMPDAAAAALAEAHLDACRAAQDSCGGVVECVIKGLPAGVGEPCSHTHTHTHTHIYSTPDRKPMTDQSMDTNY